MAEGRIPRRRFIMAEAWVRVRRVAGPRAADLFDLAKNIPKTELIHREYTVNRIAYVA